MSELKKLLPAVLAAATLAAASAGAVFAQGQPVTAGVIIYIKGTVNVTPGGKGKPVPVQLNYLLHEGDILETGPSSQASIAFKEGAEVRLNEKSQFTVAQKSGGTLERIKLGFGQLWTQLIGHQDGDFNIRTNTAVASVRGTEADVQADSGMTTVKVYDGHVDLGNSAGLTHLLAGEIASATKSGAPTPARTMTKTEKGTWQNKIKPGDVNAILKQLQAAIKSGQQTIDITINRNGKTEHIQATVKPKNQ
jgi:hypothetical protein